MTRGENAARRAVAAGRLVRPRQCEQCGQQGTVEAAHYDYRQPLNVRWLCHSCHMKWDHAEPKSLAGADQVTVSAYRRRRQATLRWQEVYEAFISRPEHLRCPPPPAEPA